MLLFLRLLRESLAFALHEISVNKVRTMLSLLGITIGIFCIISVFTIFDSLEIQIRGSIESLGNDVVYIQKWPWRTEGEYEWWEYLKRAEPDLNDMKQIQRRSTLAGAVAFLSKTSRTIKFQSNSIENVVINLVSEDYDKVNSFEISRGRYISPGEFISGKNVAVIGNDIAENLFGDSEPVGKRFKLFGSRVDVIGVIKKEGNDVFGESPDQQVIIPVNYGRNHVDLRNVGNTLIMVKAKPGITTDYLSDELTGILRSVRKLKPMASNDFAINEIDLLSEDFDNFFNIVAIIGWIIGGFSLLVGGFGIANIMFVSVKERTKIIGIQKSMGAKQYFILVQFLAEAIFLSLLGGLVGLILVFFITIILTNTAGMDFFLTTANITLGLAVSALIGLVSGFVPAWNASKLDPVEAMRSTF